MYDTRHVKVYDMAVGGAEKGVKWWTRGGVFIGCIYGIAWRLRGKRV
jgi:hypothetical protein